MTSGHAIEHTTFAEGKTPLPKVLILGQPFVNDKGGGITLSNLFAGWQKEKLAVACLGYLLTESIDTTICHNYYQLGHKEHKWAFPFNYVKRKYHSGPLKFEEKKIQNLTPPAPRLRDKVIMNVVLPFLNYTGLSHCISKIVLSEEFRSWVNEFNPDIIYAQAATRTNLLFCIAVHAFLQKPLIFHMMDDWPSTISESGLFKKYWHRKIDQEFRKLLDQTTMLMSISDHMALEYKVRYGKDAVTFHNPINLDFWKKHQKTDYDFSEQPTILYAGRTGLGIQTSLKKIANAIQSVNKELNLSFNFILQTEEKPSWVDQYRCAQHQYFVPYPELPKVFSEADFLLLPYDFSQKSIKYIQYSMPTKAPEYMISGTPIIIFAPEVVAITQYAKQYDWAKVVTKNDVSELAKTIKHLVLNKVERQQIANSAKKLAEEKHSATKITREFKKVISAIAIRNNEYLPGSKN